jgi:hypothetical protein
MKMFLGNFYSTACFSTPELERAESPLDWETEFDGSRPAELGVQELLVDFEDTSFEIPLRILTPARA